MTDPTPPQDSDRSHSDTDKACGVVGADQLTALAANADNHQIPRWLLAELRSDHAGEAGAVMIYRGILAASKDPGVRRFAHHHLETELEHLTLMEQLLPQSSRTALLPLWRMMGWLTGALPALFGANAVYATIDAVETFVDTHYQEQVDRLDPEGKFRALRELLVRCQQDEIAHRDEARQLACSKRGLLLACWQWLVGAGSLTAVRVARLF
jgi:ubiquinone biosynthesis monooxygenase Coq7